MIGLEPGRNADVARLPEPNTVRPLRPLPDWDAGTARRASVSSRPLLQRRAALYSIPAGDRAAEGEE
jgi:hypothetical protein